MTKRKQRWFEKLESDPKDLYRDAAKGVLLAILAALLWVVALVGLGSLLLNYPAEPPSGTR